MRILLLLTFAITTGARAAGPPLGLDFYMPIPPANPLTRKKIALGRRLFFDKRLSRDGTLACVSCHDPKLAFSNGLVAARGTDGGEGKRNVPALHNRGYGAAFFWDGRAKTLEQQVMEPILNPKEMALTVSELEHRTRLTATEVITSLASYLRTIRSGNSPFDRYVAGNTNALSHIETAGLAVFRGKGNCWNCHVGPNFSDERFHNTGVAWRNGRVRDEGRVAVSNRPEDYGAFKTPTLREAARTAPYMHDGSLATLEDVVEYYDRGGNRNPNLDAVIQPLHLSPEEKRATVAFLLSLTGRIREGK